MPAPDEGRSELGLAALQIAASLALYVIAEASPGDLQALRMRLWHYTARGAQAGARALGHLGLYAERRYDIVKS